MIAVFSEVRKNVDLDYHLTPQLYKKPKLRSLCLFEVIC